MQNLSRKSQVKHALIAVMTAASVAIPAQAQIVSFTGLAINLCVLTVTTPGLIAVSANGTTMASTEVGGLPATMTVVATGATPTIQFSAPQATGPGGWGGSPVASIAYTSLGGANQAYTSSASSRAVGGLLDTFTFNGRIQNATGFTTGTYTLATTATCQQ
jgi:hypothetical protein